MVIFLQNLFGSNMKECGVLGKGAPQLEDCNLFFWEVESCTI